MKYITAYLLCALAGKKPKEEDLTKILNSIDIKIDKDKMKSLLKQVENKTIFDIIKEGKLKYKSIPPCKFTCNVPKECTER